MRGTTASKWIRFSGVVSRSLYAPLLRRGATIAIYTLLISSSTAGDATTTLRRYEAVEPHMGTLARVTVYTSSEESAKQAFHAAFDRIRSVDRVLSDYQPESELSQLTKIAVNKPTRISDDLFAVLEASQRLAESTSGAFDITLGPVTRLWRDARRVGRPPDSEALRDAASRTGFGKLHLDARERTAMVGVAGMALDVGAIGKGYAASEAIATLTRMGVRSSLVALSGDLAFSEAPPGERGWRISVYTGDETVPGVPSTLELTNAAVSTSGSSEQHLDADGVRYSHIIDPSSKLGVTGDLTVTVIARHGIEADGLDTAVSVVGVERGLALIESRRDAAGMIVKRTSTGTRVFMSSRFPKISAASKVSER